MKSLLTAVALTLLPLYAFAAPSSPSANDMMGAMFDGPPKLATTKLDPSAYVTTRVQKLANARIAYVNWDAIDEILLGMGYANPPTKLTPELTQAILNKAGYAMPMAGEPEATYAQDFRDLFSIRYGGHWINYNFGSGRNGAGGVVDTKGIGRTTLVRPWSDGGHASGTMHLAEAVHEAVWSNILNQELPFGANRVLFILTTGTNVDGNREGAAPRAIMVREDPLRPAYFQPNDGVYSNLMSEALRDMHSAADQKRMTTVLPRLIESLPMPASLPSNATPAEKLRAGFLEFVDRSAYVYATGYARQIILSGVSTSNTQINGTALDFGATTSVIGYPKAKLSIGESPHGTTASLKSDLIIELADDLRRVLPPDLSAALPSNEELSERTDAQYAKRVLQGMLEMAGAPKEFSLEAVSAPKGRTFAKTVLKIAQAGNSWTQEVFHSEMPSRLGRYNLERVLNALVRGDDDLAKALSNAELRERLQAGYADYRSVIEQIGAREGITPDSLRAYAETAVSTRNRGLFDVLSNPRKDKRLEDVQAKFSYVGDDNSVQTFVDKMVEKNVREFKSAPFTLEVSDRSALREGKATRVTLDLKTGQVSSQARRLPGDAAKMPVTCRELFR
jgi:hypothetical protein